MPRSKGPASLSPFAFGIESPQRACLAHPTIFNDVAPFVLLYAVSADSSPKLKRYLSKGIRVRGIQTDFAVINSYRESLKPPTKHYKSMSCINFVVIKDVFIIFLSEKEAQIKIFIYF